LKQRTFDIATCIYYTGIDPFTKQAVYVARGLRDRKMQQALMQCFKPANYFTVLYCLNPNWNLPSRELAAILSRRIIHGSPTPALHP
jgi:hypothetical protein